MPSDLFSTICSVKYFENGALVASLVTEPMSEVKTLALGAVPQLAPEAKPAMVLVD